MAPLVWFTTGVALWHFTVFLPDRFWGGIVGALLGAVDRGDDHRRDRPDRRPATRDRRDRHRDGDLFAIPGTLLGLAVVYCDRRPRRGDASRSSA